MENALPGRGLTVKALADQAAGRGRVHVDAVSQYARVTMCVHEHVCLCVCACII